MKFLRITIFNTEKLNKNYKPCKQVYYKKKQVGKENNLDKCIQPICVRVDKCKQ